MSTQAAAPPFTTHEQQADAARLGMWVFIASELLFFGPLFLGYVYGRTHFPEAFAAASRHADVVLGTANTAVLLTSSCFMALAVEACRARALRLARVCLIATAALGCVFLVVKGIEYRQDWHEQFVPGFGFLFGGPHIDGAELFFYLYFAMTGVHALHLSIGITAVLFFAATLEARVAGTQSEHVEVTGLYWHFVDVVWIFLYPMLYLLGRAT